MPEAVSVGEEQRADLNIPHHTFEMGLASEDPSISHKVKWRVSLGDPHWLLGSNDNGTLQRTLPGGFVLFFLLLLLFLFLFTDSQQSQAK